MVGVTTYNITANEIKDLILEKYGKVEGQVISKEIKVDGMIVDGNTLFELSIVVDRGAVDHSDTVCEVTKDSIADGWDATCTRINDEDAEYTWEVPDSVWNSDHLVGEDEEYVWDNEELILNGIEVLDEGCVSLDDDLPEIDYEV